MKKLLIFSLVVLFVTTGLFAQNIFLAGHDEYDPADSTSVRYGTSGSRGLTAGADLDGDGLQEVYAAHYGHGGGVVCLEVTEEGKMEQVWHSDTTTTDFSYSSGTRIVQTGDLDGDGLGEVIFFRGRYYTDSKAGLYIYEATGGDNEFKEPVFFSINDLGARFDFNGEGKLTELRSEYFVVNDVDGDDTEEIIFASNGPSWVTDRIDTTDTDTIEYGHSEDMFGVLSATGDLQGLAGDITVEFVTSARDIDMGTVSPDNPLFGYDARLGSGSAINVLVTDIDGDGNKEIYCHAWSAFNNFFVEATGPDTYSFGDTTNVHGDVSGDHVCLMNAAAADIDEDGKDEVYAPNYYTGNVWKIFDSNGEATNLTSSEIVLANDTTGGENAGALFGATAVDINGDGTEEVYFGGVTGSKGDIISYDGSTWTGWNTDTIADGFVAKMDHADLDQDGNLELVTAHQSVPDSIIQISDGDTTTIANPHNWIVRVSEYGDSTLSEGSSVEEYNVVTPDQYKLKKAYPNPFNPVTTIEYVLPLRKKISLTVYNSLGQKVKELVSSEMKNAGSHRINWNGKNDNGKLVSSGTYIYVLKYGNYKKSKKVTFLK